jgi:hypothetical protein
VSLSMSMTLRASRQMTIIVTITLTAYLALGCVTGELRSMETAKAKYEDCVAEYSAQDPYCRKLHERLLEAQARYENDTGRAWTW